MIHTICSTEKPSVVLPVMVCAVLFVLLGEESRAEAPLRVALIDAGAKTSAPPALLDLLVVELSQQEGLVVLERQEIATVLSEQQRNLAIAGEASQADLVDAGRIFGADALVLITAEAPNKQGLQAIEARIVETRRGVRFGKTVFAWSKDGQAIAKQIASATEQIVGRLGRIQNAQGKFTLVSLAGFRTDELSQEAHRFKRNLESWLESWLASQPGIAVAERTTVLPLIAERKLSDDLPAALGEADVTIDGTFRLDFSQAEPQVELTVRVIRKDRTVATRSLHSPISEQAKLREAAGKAVLKILAIQAAALFDAKTEARLLTDEAERLLTLEQRSEAPKRLVTAYALEPDNLRIQALILHAGLGIGDNDWNSVSYDDAFYSRALFLSNVARQVLDKIEQGVQPPNDLSFYQTDRLFKATLSFCRLIRRCSEYGVPENVAVQHEWFRVAVSDLYHRTLKATQKRDSRLYEECLGLGMDIGFYWAKTPEEALAERRNLIERADDLDEVGIMGGWVLTNDFQFRLNRNKAWEGRKNLPALLKLHYEEMASSRRVILQARGEKGLAQYALRELDDRELAIKHYRRFIDLIVDELIPNYPKIKMDIGGFWLEELTDRQFDLGLTHEEAGELWSRVIRAAWSKQCPRASQPWVRRIKQTAFHLEKAGQARQADTLLQDCLDWLEEAPRGRPRSELSSQWKRTTSRLQILQAELAVRHPNLENGQVAILDFRVPCRSCLNLKNLQPEILKAALLPESILQKVSGDKNKHRIDFMLSHLCKLAGMTTTKEGYAVLCVIEEMPRNNQNRRNHRVVVARLDRQGKFKSASLCTESFKQVGEEFQDEILWPFATSEGSLFLAPPGNGVLWIPPAGEPIHFSSKYLEKSDATHQSTPFANAWQLIPIQGKLYVSSGPNVTRPTLYELDYRRRTTAELMNAHSLPKDHPLQQRRGFSLMVGPPGELLIWAHRDGRKPRKKGRVATGDLFLVNVENKSAHPAERPFHLNRRFFEFSMVSSFRGIEQSIGYGASDGSLAIFNPHVPEIEWLVPGSHETPPENSKIKLQRASLAINRYSVLTSQKKVGEALVNDWQKYHGVAVASKDQNSFDWLLYDRGNPNPRRLVADNLPDPKNVKRFLLDDQGQILMMTSKEVFRIQLPAKGNQ